MSDDAEPIPETYSWRLYCPACGWRGAEQAAQCPDCQECGTPLRIDSIRDRDRRIEMIRDKGKP